MAVWQAAPRPGGKYRRPASGIPAVSGRLHCGRCDARQRIPLEGHHWITARPPPAVFNVVVQDAERFQLFAKLSNRLYFGEYSANGYFAGQPQTEQNANTWKSALGEAAFLTGCERNSDVVRMTSYAPLLAHIPAKGWAQNLIEFNPAHVNPTLNYEVERLFSAHLGETAYQVSVEQCAAARHLYVSATGRDGNDSCRYIKIVNTSGSPVDVTLEIARGLTGLGGMRQESNDSDAAQRNLIRLEVETLSANPQAKTTLGYRGKASGTILPKQRSYTLPSPSSLFAMKIEPYSVTLVTSR